MTDRENRSSPPEGNAFRDSFLALIERPELQAATRTFGTLLDELVHECDLVLRTRDRPDPEYARRHLAAVAADLGQVLESLRSLTDFPGRIDDARAAVAASDALRVLEPLVAKLGATFSEPGT